MNIQNDLQGVQPIERGGALSGSQGTTGVQSAVNVSAADEAHVSAAAYLVSQAVALPEINAEKVAAVQAALADGSYQVSAFDVAGKLIDHMQLNGE